MLIFHNILAMFAVLAFITKSKKMPFHFNLEFFDRLIAHGIVAFNCDHDILPWTDLILLKCYLTNVFSLS